MGAIRGVFGARSLTCSRTGSPTLGVALRSRDRVVSQRPVPRLQDRRRRRPESAGPVPARSRRRWRRSASSCGRWSSSRPTTRSPRPRRARAADPRVERVLICTPDKDLAQCVRGPAGRAARSPRRSGARRGGRAREVRRARRHRSPIGWRWSATAPTAFRGCPGWGAKSAAAVLARYEHLEAIPERGDAWDVQVRGAAKLAATLVGASRPGAALPRPRNPSQGCPGGRGGRVAMARGRQRVCGLRGAARPGADHRAGPPPCGPPRGLSDLSGGCRSPL